MTGTDPYAGEILGHLEVATTKIRDVSPPGHRRHVVPRLRPPRPADAMRVFLDGATGRDRSPLVPQLLKAWLHVEDAASAAVAALERGAPGIYNVVDDEPAPQPEWLPVLARALRADPPPAAEKPPPPETPEMSLRGASNAKAKRELGWRPRYASWREGFAASLA